MKLKQLSGEHLGKRVEIVAGNTTLSGPLCKIQHRRKFSEKTQSWSDDWGYIDVTVGAFEAKDLHPECPVTVGGWA